MNKVFDKLKPVFEAIAANKYISAIRDGFIACMPIIIFSSIFMMVAYVPNAWGFYWPDNVTNTLMVAYNYSMGLLALFVAGTTARTLNYRKQIKLIQWPSLWRLKFLLSFCRSCRLKPVLT